MTDGRERFDNWAKNYDRSILNPYFNCAHSAIIRALNPKNGMRILDIGCGTGKLLEKIAGIIDSGELVGTDFSEEMIEVARKTRKKEIKFLVSDAMSLDFENESFDAVLNAVSFHHYPEQGRALNEMYRVLKNRGRLYLADHSFDFFPGLAYAMSFAMSFFEGPIKISGKRKMRSMLDRAGFFPLYEKSFGLIGTLYVAEKKGAENG